MIDRLPPRLAERARAMNDRLPEAGRDGVICWLRVSLRAEDNPALEAAAHLASALGVPLLVVQGLGERYPWASDRLHTFVLEGAADLAAALTDRGVAYALHVERPGHRGRVLDDLAARATAFVVDEYPVSPWRELTRRFADRAPCPVVGVDAACVVPMRLLPSFDRAYAFRAAHAPLVARHLEPVPPAARAAPWSAALPFEPVDPRAADLDALVAAAAIDHDVAPVPHTSGGSRAAAARWGAFRDARLPAYAAVRNDPLVPDGVSRLSPYLHFGMISARRVAREARAIGGPGAEKFLDELLVWRELAWGWCWRSRWHDHRALPDWARASWARHAADPRETRPALTLDRGETGDPLWDAAQRHLRVHGELHNNVRMTWGKAFAGWSPDLETAVRRATDLNHRYALDGRDPSSVAGILWCFGLFDRPHAPERPILGTVRPRLTRDHARRLDVARYAAWTGRPVVDRPPRVAVIGAGPAGAAAARVLADHGLRPVVFDKGRGAGGRTSTRRDGIWRFDHGAPGLPDAPRRWIRLWREADRLRMDGAQLRPPEAMADLCRHWLGDIALRAGAPVTRLGSDGEVEVEGRVESFDHVIVTVPGPQAALLLAPVAPELAAAAAAAVYAPAVVLLAGDGAPLTPPAEGPEGWEVRLQRDPRAAVVEAPARWVAAHLEAELPLLAALAAPWVEAALGRPPERLVAHRWRYARVVGPVRAPPPTPRFSLAGDAFAASSDIVGAIDTGLAAAGRFLARVSRCAPRPAAGSSG